MVFQEGSVRADLAGGTLDLEPINLILPDVKTINIALSLKAKVELSFNESKEIKIYSKDYQCEYHYPLDVLQDKELAGDKYQEMSFVLQILSYFQPETGITLKLSSGAPAGSGLGGSSTMGVVLYKALCSLLDKNFDSDKAIKVVRSIESRILNQGIAGLQDYYPALYGGVLSLAAKLDHLGVEQLYEDDFAEFLEDRLLLVFSGKSRQSGINNWEVYKNFFDGKGVVRNGLKRIADLTNNLYQAIKDKNFEHALTCIVEEGQVRKELFPDIATQEIINLERELLKKNLIEGIKICGAGGGGCFLILLKPETKNEVEKVVNSHSMNILEFAVEAPLK